MNLSEITPLKLIKWSAATFVASLVVWFGGGTLASRLPEPAERPELRDEPEQTETLRNSFHVQRGHKDWEILPMAEYRLRGLVVTLSNANDYFNLANKDAGDNLNSHDFCAVWSSMAESAKLSDYKFTHGDFTCYVQWFTREAGSAFHADQLSNTHVIPANDELARAFNKVRIGDEIELEGQLVDYTHDRQFYRRTSLSRTDSNESSRSGGACEVMYVTGFRFLKRHHAPLYTLAAFGEGVSLGSAIVLLISLFVLPFVIAESREETDSTPERRPPTARE